MFDENIRDTETAFVVRDGERGFGSYEHTDPVRSCTRVNLVHEQSGISFAQDERMRSAFVEFLVRAVTDHPKVLQDLGRRAS
jgi:hypothetical protein